MHSNCEFSPNHIPIQNCPDTVKDGDEYRLRTVATIMNDQDKHWQKCRMPN